MLMVPLNDKVSHPNRKDVRLPQQLQRAMAAEAEAAREARAKVIAAEGEHKSSRALAHAAEVIAQSPAALQVNSIVSDQRCWFVSLTSTVKATSEFHRDVG